MSRISHTTQLIHKFCGIHCARLFVSTQYSSTLCTVWISPSIFSLLKKLMLALALAPLTMIAPALGQSFGTPTLHKIGVETIVVPTPPSFLETSKNAPEMWEQAKTFTSSSVRLLAHYALESEAKTFIAGGEVRLSQYMYVQTPVRAQGITTTQAQFDKLRVGVISLQSDMAAKFGPKLKDELARASKEFGEKQGNPLSIKAGEIVPVSIDRNDAKALIYTTLMNVTSSQSDALHEGNVLTSAAVIFTKGKVLTLSVNRDMKSPKDIQIVRSFVSDWVSAIVAAN